MTFSTFVKGTLTPGSIAFLGLCAAIWLGLRFVWPRSVRIARIWLRSVAILYVALALPVTANMIVGALPRTDAITADRARDLDLIVVFDGDNRVGRVQEALRLHGSSPAVTVLVLGESWIAGELVEAGVPRNLVIQEYGPGTTHGQVAWMKRQFGTLITPRTALVASRLQMPRVARLVETMGMSVRLAASPIDAQPASSGVWLLVPSYIALRASRDAIYEHAALAYYDWRGWTQ